jgi:hypothetical protein
MKWSGEQKELFGFKTPKTPRAKPVYSHGCSPRAARA